MNKILKKNLVKVFEKFKDTDVHVLHHMAKSF